MLPDIFLDLGCNDIKIQSITRFGHQTIKPRPLRIKLRPQQDGLTLHKAATKLALLHNIIIQVFILTALQRNLKFTVK